MTLIVAVKPNCDGCRSFLVEGHSFVEAVTVLVVARSVEGIDDFVHAPVEMFAAPELLDALEVTWPPFYVLIAPDPTRVVAEGIAFSPDQVAHEIARFLV